MKKPIVCLDWDGVVHSYTSGWQGIDVCPDPPTDGLWHALEAYHQHFTLHVYSTRSAEECGRVAMRGWFVTQASAAGYDLAEGCQVAAGTGAVLWYVTAVDRDRTERFTVFFPAHKPPAFLTLDDRGMTFTGVWPDVQTLLAFQPWTKHGPPPNERPMRQPQEP